MNALQRLDAEEELMARLVECIGLGHPNRDRMMGVTMEQVRAFSDSKLTILSDRLGTWIESRRAALAAAVDEGALAAPVAAG